MQIMRKPAVTVAITGMAKNSGSWLIGSLASELPGSEVFEDAAVVGLGLGVGVGDGVDVGADKSGAPYPIGRYLSVRLLGNSKVM